MCSLCVCCGETLCFLPRVLILWLNYVWFVQLSKKTAKSVITELRASPVALQFDIEGFRKAYAEKTPAVPQFRAAGVRNVVTDTELDLQEHLNNGANPHALPSEVSSLNLPCFEELSLEEMSLISEGDAAGPLSLLSFEPKFMRLPPPILEPDMTEVCLFFFKWRQELCWCV